MTSSAQQDESAVAAVRRGDAERYRELVERHERRVYAVAWSRLGDAALAEEVTQEVFIRAYRRLWLLGDGAKFAAWVNTIARHAAINLGLRHRRELNKRKRWALENPNVSTEENFADETDPLCTPETLRQTLAELPAAHRECLVLFYLEGKSGAEAAAALGISESALRVRLHRARAAMRERLEERLADSLEQLKPGKPLVPAVMAGILAAPSAKTVTGGGATILSTLVKFSPFKWLLPFFAAGIGTLPGVALTALAAKAEERNFRDHEGFRAQASRAIYRRILWLVPLQVILMIAGFAALKSRLGEHQTDVILAVFVVGVFAYFWITQRNRFQSGMLVWYAIITAGMVLVAAGLIPRIANAFFLIAAFLWLMWIIPKRPARMDNSLFFRAGLGMLEVPPPDASSDIPTARLEKSDLMRFARFLGDRWLVNDFRWRPEGLLLRQIFLKPWRANKAGLFPFLFHRDSSNLLLTWKGEVTAHISEADARTRRVLSASKAVLRTQLEIQVAAAVKYAWREFRNSNISAAEKALGEKPDAEIFFVPPARAASTRWMQKSLALVVIMYAVMIMLGWLPKIVNTLEAWFSR